MSELRKMSCKHPADTSSSDSEFELPQKKTMKMSPLVCGEIDKNLKALRSQVDSLFAIEKTLKIPLSLRKLLTENFRCIICHSVMKPPVIFSRCCKRVLGCERCIDTWYRGDGGLSRTCPQCRAERGYSDTSRVNGLDDFLNAVGKIMENDGAGLHDEAT